MNKSITHVSDTSNLAPEDLAAFKATWERLAEMRAEAQRIEEAARDLQNSLLDSLPVDGCPEWCTSGASTDPMARMGHTWGGLSIGAGREHQGVLSTWVVSQSEFVRVDGTRWYSRIDRVRRAV